MNAYVRRRNGDIVRLDMDLPFIVWLRGVEADSLSPDSDIVVRTVVYIGSS